MLKSVKWLEPHSGLHSHNITLTFQVFENCRVTGFTTEVDDSGMHRVTGVDTAHGHIKTKNVVNCAGVWSPYIGSLANVKVPLCAMYHAYVVTERIEGIKKMPNVRDHDASVYLKLQGDGLSIGGYEQNPIFWEKVLQYCTYSVVSIES